jgi:hypothetical protein
MVIALIMNYFKEITDKAAVLIALLIGQKGFGVYQRRYV